MKYPKLLLSLLLILATAALPACNALENKGIDLSAYVQELKDAYQNAPIILETVFRGKTVRIVLKNGQAVALTSDGQVLDAVKVTEAASEAAAE